MAEDRERPASETSRVDLTEDSIGASSEEQPSLLGSIGRTLVRMLRDVLGAVVPALIIALLLVQFVAQTTYVHGHSMEPNLHSQQRLLIEKVGYRFHTPRRGDVVVLDVEGTGAPLIKRVIGLPGEVLTIRNSQVFIDGEILEEPYLAGGRQSDWGPVDVPPGHVFVMGDNRRASNDSRLFGPVPIDSIVGRAWISYWPVEEIGLVR